MPLVSLFQPTEYTILRNKKREELRQILNRPTLTRVTFSLWTKHFNKRCVCTPAVQCVALSLTGCVGYDKLLFHERNVILTSNFYTP